MNEEISKDLGMVTAYAYAVSKGYTGTETQFAQLMANYATVGAAAAASASAAANSARDAEAWADGQRAGTDVPSSDPAYENNAKYYAEAADESAQLAADVASLIDKDDGNKEYAMAWSIKNGHPCLALTERT